MRISDWSSDVCSSDLLVPDLDGFVRPLDLVARPTPVTEAPALARHWGQAALWVTRDALSNSLSGGSKVHNLEFFLGPARAAGAPGVVTIGHYAPTQEPAAAVLTPLAGFRTAALHPPQP